MKTVLVTGGGGFLGKAIIKQLLEEEKVSIKSLSRSAYPELTELGCATTQMDLCKPNMDDLVAVLRDVDVVFHVAAKAGVWGSKESFWSINVIGTRNLLEASQRAGVKKFIYTSSPSAVWNGGDEINLTESQCPYPSEEDYLTYYPLTKATASVNVYILLRLESSTKNQDAYIERHRTIHM